MINLKQVSKYVVPALIGLTVVVAVSRCGSGTASVSQTFVQVDRLARPAVNEGLVLLNDQLNAFNAIPPTFDLALTNPAVAAVVSQVTTVLTITSNFGRNALSNANAALPADVIGGFVPDVMRIDTSAGAIAIGNMAYNGDAVGSNGGTAGSDPVILTGGRKLEDQVMNITLAYLFAGPAAAAGSNDPATFAGSSGSAAYADKLTYDMGVNCATALTNSTNATVPTNQGAPGHNCLYGQTARNGAAQFPYLARPY